jgi:NAD(P)-dependent dehydrogenase (short-subunit alcohol dehydrogenase family)
MQGLKNIIVTGSNKGIGFGIANYLASKQGWNVIMACRNLELGEKSKAEIKEKHPNASVQLEKLDVSDSKSIEEFVGTIKQKYQQIHCLVNNAGVAVKGDAFDVEGIKWTFQTVLFLPLRTTTAPSNSPRNCCPSLSKRARS